MKVTVTTEAGESVRVIVDGDNVNDITQGPGEARDYDGDVVTVRKLGLGAAPTADASYVA